MSETVEGGLDAKTLLILFEPPGDVFSISITTELQLLKHPPFSITELLKSQSYQLGMQRDNPFAGAVLQPFVIGIIVDINHTISDIATA